MAQKPDDPFSPTHPRTDRFKEIGNLVIYDPNPLHPRIVIQSPYLLEGTGAWQKAIKVEEVEIAGRDPVPIEYLNAGQVTREYTIFLDETDIPVTQKGPSNRPSVEDEIDKIAELSSLPVTFFISPKGSGGKVDTYDCFIIHIDVQPEMLHPITKRVVRAKVKLGCVGR